MADKKIRMDINCLKMEVLERIFFSKQSRRDLIEHFNVRPNTISKIISELKQEKKIVSDTSRQTGGRPLTLFKINNDYRYYGGIMIEGEYINGAVIGFAGEVVYSHLKQNPQNMLPGAFISNLVHVIEKLIENTPGRELEQIHMCGNYFYSGGRYFASGYLAKEVPIEVLPILEEKFKVEFTTGSGIEALIMSERRMGKGTDNSLFIHFGAGISTGMVKSLKGPSGETVTVGELGHTRKYSSLPCRCGRTGCLETVVSVWAIKDFLRNNPALLSPDQKNYLDSLSLLDILGIYLDLAIAKQNKKVIEHLNYMAETFAIAVRNVVDLVAPEMIILSGTMMKAGQIILPKIEKELANTSTPLHHQFIPVLISELDNSFQSIGAAMVILLKEITRKCTGDNIRQ